ncbi:hypothetical protein ABGY98_004736 [Salmonella enterica]|nr:hypothetical protein [Salmonella enterica]ECJ5896152.1 hypothetical protein [Salmonella enterica subsp. diarizonae]ECS3896877.1 hypothetical protein [Salmonella enterica subsp. diarizonae serovar 48:i:z]EAM6407297.1 hypothetical protein [Salmonella enterica]EAN2415026.1 hypothetical protein [Salmonella enterica]
MHNFKPSDSLSQSDNESVFYFNGDASTEALLNNALTRIYGVMRLFAAIAESSQDIPISASSLSAISLHQLSDAYSLLMEVRYITEKYGDVREVIKQHTESGQEARHD